MPDQPLKTAARKVCLFLPEVKHKVNSMGLHFFNRKSMTISFVGAMTIPEMNTFRHIAFGSI
jgi:hypothetical protein